jgi:hypothetical protein
MREGGQGYQGNIGSMSSSASCSPACSLATRQAKTWQHGICRAVDTAVVDCSASLAIDGKIFAATLQCPRRDILTRSRYSTCSVVEPTRYEKLVVRNLDSAANLTRTHAAHQWEGLARHYRADGGHLSSYACVSSAGAVTAEETHIAFVQTIYSTRTISGRTGTGTCLRAYISGCYGEEADAMLCCRVISRRIRESRLATRIRSLGHRAPALAPAPAPGQLRHLGAGEINFKHCMCGMF